MEAVGTASSLDSNDPARRAEDKKAREAASLRERENQVRRERERNEREAGKSRLGADREDSERRLRTLYIDAVRDHEVSSLVTFISLPYTSWALTVPNLNQAQWDNEVVSLARDPRFDAPGLSNVDKRHLFDAHLDELYTKRLTTAEALFARHAPALNTPLDDVLPSITPDPAITRLNVSPTRLAQLYESWASRRRDKARADLMALLGESAFVEYWGRMRKEGQARAADGKNVLDNVDQDDEEGGGEADLKAMAAAIDLKEVHAVLQV